MWFGLWKRKFLILPRGPPGKLVYFWACWHSNYGTPSTMGTNSSQVSDFWILQMWKPAKASAKDVSVAIPAEQGSAPWAGAGVELCNISV